MCPVDTVNELDDDRYFGRLCLTGQCFRTFSGFQLTPTAPMSTGPAPLIVPPSDEPYTGCFRHNTAPLADSAPQRPQLTPAVTLRVEPDQPVHQLRSGRVRLLLEPAQDVQTHPLEQVRSCPTKRRITEPFFRSIHAWSFLRDARERVNSMPCRSQYVTRVSSMSTLSLSESIPLTGTGNTCATASSPSTTSDRSRAGSGTASVHPEQTPVTTRLWMNASEATPPPWATRSISR